MDKVLCVLKMVGKVVAKFIIWLAGKLERRNNYGCKCRNNVLC